MANQEHLEDFRRRGAVDGGLAAEVFAESYARFAAGLPLPADLHAFWSREVTGLKSQSEVNYTPWWPNKVTRCQRCTMFVPGIDPRHNRCTAVEGQIALHGHCGIFEIGGARQDAAEEDRPPAVGYEAHRRRLERLARDLDKLKVD